MKTKEFYHQRRELFETEAKVTVEKFLHSLAVDVNKETVQEFLKYFTWFLLPSSKSKDAVQKFIKLATHKTVTNFMKSIPVEHHKKLFTNGDSHDSWALSADYSFLKKIDFLEAIYLSKQPKKKNI